MDEKEHLLTRELLNDHLFNDLEQDIRKLPVDSDSLDHLWRFVAKGAFYIENPLAGCNTIMVVKGVSDEQL